MPRVSIKRAVEEVAARDRVMAKVIAQGGPMRLRPPRDPDHFVDLAETIVYQQLAAPAARAIWGRVAALFDGGPITPERVLALPDAALRGAGLSINKMTSMRDLAAKVLDGTVPLENIQRLKDDDIVARLSQVRGIGRWTAEMFLIFQLRRMDVWPVDDYGVRKGWTEAYGLPELIKPKALMAEGERFRPYRTVVAWYCWRVVDMKAPGA